ncbi:MAG TPA: S41 family peptidase [Armatimonadota bacterium]|nr:S41 family peptidase [Armatimonadota bacterium]HOJ20852.1 S41 family peptidase [Armatimonadota bacterium]HOM81688.1 S41 family peptidase [Armatimonadota bacterium]HPO72285.1 S41 family peptidase [Armatimonadota bacterium]HPT96615.1 S41 family peptidase [Armatimonadota bacterium]
MKENRFRHTIFGFAITGLLAFLVGFLYHVVAFASPTPLPVHISQVLGGTSGGGAAEADDASVKPLEVFWKTYTLVRQRYRLVGVPGWDDDNLIYAGLDGLLRSLGDPYTRFLDPKAYKQMIEQNQGQFQGIGAYLQQSRDQRHILLAPIPNGPAAAAGLKRGDILLKINGTNAVGMDIDKAKNLIRGPAGTTVELTVGRRQDPSRPEGADNPMKTVKIVVERAVIKPDEVKFSAGPPAGHEKETEIGYIRLHQFNEDTENQLDRALVQLGKKRVKGIVLDLRGNPGGLLDVAIGVASRFLEEGPVVFIQEAGGNRRAYNANRRQFNGEHRKYLPANTPVVVLVNRDSASASEIVAGCLKDHKIAKLVGETTFGKGLVQTIIPLEADGNRGALKITTAKYFTPNGTDINHKGIEPDYKVVARGPDEDPFAAETTKEDPQLDRAVEVIRKQIQGGAAALAEGAKH